jgi:MSHA biogenesis protein MshL
MLTKGVGWADTDVRSNSVIVTDIAPQIQQIRKVVTALDRDEKEVLIEARIIQISLDDRFKMGVDWEAIIPEYHQLTFKNQNFVQDVGQNVIPQSLVSIGTLDQDHYTAALQMISRLGKSRVLSSPRIAVVNNQEAKILVGTTKPYVTSTTTTTASGPATTAEAVNFIEVGVKLHVTPTVHDDGYITMKIKPEVSTSTTSVRTSQSNEIPIVDSSEVDTTIRVKDGVTIIIGGLIKDETTDTKSGVPVLGDIPFLGRAFTRLEKGTAKTEIVIFLTPHIITGDVHFSATDESLLEQDK